ncbi:MAG: phospholipase D family protein [Acidobacteriota bacterium]|nr:phospholipase D family protein [Acidobacteriota bacterium]
MKITFLGQGLEATSENSVGNHLIEFFSQKDFHTFTGMSAFVSQKAIDGIAHHIAAAKEHLINLTLITGVDQKGTSKEALEALIKLDVNSYVFYVPVISPIFHPKIYLFEGEEKSELIIGSSNLTQPGLFTNIETSLLVSIDNKIETDRIIVEQLKEYFKELFDFSDPNLEKLSVELITYLVEAKIVPTEAERKATQDKIEKTEEVTAAENVISQIFPKRVTAKPPREFIGITKPRAEREKVEAREPIGVREPFKASSSSLLWDSGPLKERDLTIPKGANTSYTGSMLFKKGLLEGIDQRHYFRDEVFYSLSWDFDTNPRTTHYERAIAFFKLIIMGIDYGVFELTLSHNTRTDTATYEQKNSMTSISWGEAREHIAKDELIGRSAKLYKNEDKVDEFILVIE